MKKPWFIWLSIPAFAFLWGDTAKRLTSLRRLKKEGLWSAMDLWYKALGNMFVLWIVFVMIPAGVFAAVAGFLLEIIGYVVWNVLALGYMYFAGVYITYKHHVWRQKNISHLLKKS